MRLAPGLRLEVGRLLDPLALPLRLFVVSDRRVARLYADQVTRSLAAAGYRPERRRLLNRLESDFPQIRSKRLILLYPGGGLLPIRAWPWENFCSLSESFLAAGYAVGIIGMESDKVLAGGIVSRCRTESCVDLTGYTRSVRELMTLFHLASLLITNDGGPGHFASMTPIPSIVFFGPETHVLYRPLDKKSIPLHSPLSCSPCLSAYNHRNSPCDGDNRCLKLISPEEVLHHAYALLNPIHGEDKSP